MKKRKIILIGLLVGALVCGGGYGAYRLVKGNTTPVEVTPVAYLNLGWWNSETTSSGTITSNAVQEVQLDSDKMISQINVKEGDRVKKGQLLLKFDMDVIKAHGLETITPVVLTNTDDLQSVSPVKSGKVTEKDVIISFEK